ncbi:hypothetical protein EZS27_020008 [termite gut metagenome]|uniref:SMEK domain-containing protein n=1 Tax=termite gut metagenome TaxID=433724 RepID=A0A5J4RDD1_9ZZZZ
MIDMNRANYFSVIEEKINVLATRINKRGKLNILDLHQHSESFYQYFLNILYCWNLTNANEIKQNIEAIDLIDNTNLLLIQVSATSTKQKIESSLSKDIIKTHKNYTFKFVSISNDAKELRDKSFENPHKINFNPADDIIDTNSILLHIKGLDIDSLKKVYDFIKKELGTGLDIVKFETNLASVINILSKDDLNKNDITSEINSFQIDRKISYNNLNAAKDIIEDYRIHYGRIDKIYSEFDSFGSNKSSSVLSTIRQEYLRLKSSFSDDELFFNVIEKIIEKVMESSNYEIIPLDELELCVNILVVDAFIRCKIFENPKNYNHATT